MLLSFLFLVSPANSLNQWQKIQRKGYLSWITRTSPLTYYNSLDGIIGIEYDILSEFCRENNLKLTVLVADSNYELFKSFDNNNIDIVGGSLSLTPERLNKYASTNSYDKTNIRIISSLRKPKIRSLEDLKNYNGAILAHSSYKNIATELINKYQANILIYNGESMYELLQDVAHTNIDYTLSDMNIIDIYKSYVPKLRIGAKVSKDQMLGFYIKKTEDQSLLLKLNKFIDDYLFQNKVTRYKKVIKNSLPNSKPADTAYFLKNYEKRWQQVKPLIYEVANKYSIKPVLLGAISYQESHWNAEAVSPTLVKGLMMLTRGVAKEQGITDRFDPLQSLEGGVRHFLKMKDKIPVRITEPDRTYFALAAYNIGYGNIEKARVMTQNGAQNPDIWDDVKNYLPLLNQTEKYNVDGETAVRYVENIKVYQNLLQWKQQL